VRVDGGVLRLDASVPVRLALPAGRVLSGRVVARRLDTTAWGGSLAVTRFAGGALDGSPAVADPGTTETEAFASLSETACAGLDALAVTPSASANARVFVHAEFVLLEDDRRGDATPPLF
jgi:hypothetical protein